MLHSRFPVGKLLWGQESYAKSCFPGRESDDNVREIEKDDGKLIHEITFLRYWCYTSKLNCYDNFFQVFFVKITVDTLLFCCRYTAHGCMSTSRSKNGTLGFLRPTPFRLTDRLVPVLLRLSHIKPIMSTIPRLLPI